MERRLGRGLGSLLPQTPTQEPAREVELRLIRPNPYQPRKVFDPEALEELKNSIAEHGVLQPIVVRPREDGFELIAGERRWRASKLAGRKTVPATIREDISDEHMLELALVENVQRNDLDPMEKARAFQALREQLGLSQEQVAARVGLQRSSVANHIRLLDLPKAIQDLLANGLLGMGHARALLAMTKEAAQVDLAQRVAREQLSVRSVEQIVREANQPSKPASEVLIEPSKEAQAPAWTKEVAARIQEALGTKVRLSSNEKCRGQIVIDFYERADLERILDRVAPGAPEV